MRLVLVAFLKGCSKRSFPTVPAWVHPPNNLTFLPPEAIFTFVLARLMGCSLWDDQHLQRRFRVTEKVLDALVANVRCPYSVWQFVETDVFFKLLVDNYFSHVLSPLNLVKPNQFFYPYFDGKQPREY
ncbi:hypothetical protein EVAR_59720_1 [Eumeta japonica]|uniref:Uncharacterized protein n=1 Tax=Eumeta variegata TaxID=151549 RepID=A0A4C1XGU1_EUMVA|nr:hypothetical protein EVAR_59720_1 [Eumeta japonica]